MLFNSFEFFVFFVIVLVSYWLSPLRLQNILLLAASYIFYSFWDWRFLSLILISTAVDYLAGLKIESSRYHLSSRKDTPARLWLLLSLGTNLGILAFFKYFNFFIESLESLLGLLGLVHVAVFRLDIILPVGISFYTFQTMSYTIDIYKKNMVPTRNIIDFALYVSFFPQLVAGPIERAKSLLPMIVKRRVFNAHQFSDGLTLILFGLFKKVFVADNLAPLVDQIFALDDPSGFQVLVGAYAFAVQIYCDFSGYSDIARGCAKCLGFELMLNFNFPYLAVNPVDRWRRWHISLSTWLRDYLYIPLGGNRRGELVTYRNLGVTMFLGGLWHGAAWNFVLWGVWEGMLLIVYRIFKQQMSRLSVQGVFLGVPASIRTAGKVLLMFHLVCIGWIIFRSTSFDQIQMMISHLIFLKIQPDINSFESLTTLLIYAAPLFMCEFLLWRIDHYQWHADSMVRKLLKCSVLSTVFYMIAIYGASAQSFIYFQF